MCLQQARTTSGYYKKAFSTGQNHCDLFTFVMRAVNVLQEACPHTICDGLFLVDVFMNQAGDFNGLGPDSRSSH